MIAYLFIGLLLALLVAGVLALEDIKGHLASIDEALHELEDSLCGMDPDAPIEYELSLPDYVLPVIPPFKDGTEVAISKPAP